MSSFIFAQDGNIAYSGNDVLTTEIGQCCTIPDGPAVCATIYWWMSA
jgi:hypothetical protein